MISIIICILIISLLIGGIINIYYGDVRYKEDFQDHIRNNIASKDSLTSSAKPITHLPINSDNIDISLLLGQMDKLIKKNIEKERVLKLTKKKILSVNFFLAIHKDLYVQKNIPIILVPH